MTACAGERRRPRAASPRGEAVMLSPWLLPKVGPPDGRGSTELLRERAPEGKPGTASGSAGTLRSQTALREAALPKLGSGTPSGTHPTPDSLLLSRPGLRLRRSPVSTI